MTEKIGFEKYFKKYGNLILIKHPAFGSGRIIRRVFGITKTQFDRSVKVSRKMKDRDHSKWAESIKEFNRNKKSIDGKLQFPSVSHKQIFQLWSRMGYPFVKHIAVKSKTTGRVISEITKAIHQYEIRQIIEAIEIGHRMFNSEWFKFKYLFKHQKMPLDYFFRYPNDQYHFITKRSKDVPQSWLIECLKGEKYLRNKYSFEERISHNEYLEPYIEKLTEGFVLFHRERSYNLEDKEFKYAMARWTLYLFNFSRINNISLDYLSTCVLDGMIKYKTIFVKGTNGLLSKNFYNNQIPQALIQWDRSWFSEKKWNTKWDEITKPFPTKLSRSQAWKILAGRNK